MAAFYLIGAALTAVLYPVLFAKRYRGQRKWVVVGVVLGLVAALLWPLTLWVALALFLTGFTRPSTGVRRRRRVVFPVAAGGSLATFMIMGILAPAPASAPSTAAAVADVAPTTSPLPTTTPAPTTPPLAAAAAVVTPTKPPATRPPTTTRPPVTTTRTPAPEPEPRPAPRPQPNPRSEPEPKGDGDDDSGTKPRTGNSGHPCRPGERDGDGDGYCGEG